MSPTMYRYTATLRTLFKEQNNVRQVTDLWRVSSSVRTLLDSSQSHKMTINFRSFWKKILWTEYTGKRGITKVMIWASPAAQIELESEVQKSRFARSTKWRTKFSFTRSLPDWHQRQADNVLQSTTGSSKD